LGLGVSARARDRVGVVAVVRLGSGLGSGVEGFLSSGSAPRAKAAASDAIPLSLMALSSRSSSTWFG